MANVKAINALADKLSKIAETAASMGTEEALELTRRTILGWKNYFSYEPVINLESPVIFTAFLKLVSEGRWQADMDGLIATRLKMSLDDPILLATLMKIWQKNGYPELAVVECANLLNFDEYNVECNQLMRNIFPSGLSLEEAANSLRAIGAYRQEAARPIDGSVFWPGRRSCPAN